MLSADEQSQLIAIFVGLRSMKLRSRTDKVAITRGIIKYRMRAHSLTFDNTVRGTDTRNQNKNTPAVSAPLSFVVHFTAHSLSTRCDLNENILISNTDKPPRDVLPMCR